MLPDLDLFCVQATLYAVYAVAEHTRSLISRHGASSHDCVDQHISRRLDQQKLLRELFSRVPSFTWTLFRVSPLSRGFKCPSVESGTAMYDNGMGIVTTRLLGTSSEPSRVAQAKTSAWREDGCVNQ